ncbi:MAG: type II secretion system F family protein [bacterium JZ-2024 1]
MRRLTAHRSSTPLKDPYRRIIWVGRESVLTEFQYEAIGPDDNKTVGFVYARNRAEALATLTRRGYRVLRVEAEESTVFSEWAPLGTSLAALMHFSRSFSNLLHTGFDIHQCINFLQEHTADANIRRAVARINEDLREHPDTLANLMKRHPRIFPPLYRTLVAAGERGGFLESILRDIASFYEAELQWRTRLSIATFYPKLVVLVFIAAAFILNQIGFVSSLPYTLGLVVVALYLGYIFLSRLRLVHRAIYAIAMWLPGFGRLYRHLANARFFRVLGLQIAAGLSPQEAIPVSARSSGDFRVEAAAARIVELLDRGETLGDAFRKAGFFGREEAGMVAVGEATGDPSDLMVRMSRFHEMRADQVAHTMITMTPVITTILLGGAILLLGMSVLGHYGSILESFMSD